MLQYMFPPIMAHSALINKIFRTGLAVKVKYVFCYLFLENHIDGTSSSIQETNP